MHSYKELKKSHGQKVSQTLDSPIMFADLWDLNDIMSSLAVILLFGLLFYSWLLMSLALVWTLGFYPYLKRKYKRGIIFHWPYKYLNMNLPGLINPGRNKKYSD